MKILMPSELAERLEPQIREIVPDVSFVRFERDGTRHGDTSDVDIFLRWWTSVETYRTIVAEAPALRWIHTPSAGVDRLLVPEVVERDNLTLTNSAGAHAIPIAEFVLMFMLNHVKKSEALYTAAAEHTWKRDEELHLDELADKTVLILGLGNIGQEIARRAAAFGMRVWGSRRRPQPTEHVERVVGEHEWRALLPETDYLIVATPLTDATEGLVDANAFAQLKQGAYLINIARGQIVATEPLLDALRSGRLGGAGLDTLPEEPLPADHPLWNEPNVWITPHISWASPRMSGRTMDIFLDNVRRYAAGEPLRNQVDKTAGY